MMTTMHHALQLVEEEHPCSVIVMAPLQSLHWPLCYPCNGVVAIVAQAPLP